ncbi:MAG TPA: gluconeogenesis factor YvcK family protein, partial [Armatimonadota bacterium]|nr:gluconeogenesis factor YvcK family protein [Armatimonadota bacterium]
MRIFFRLLLPGIRLKRWVFANLAGMMIFAAGLWLLLQPQWSFQVRGALWEFWWKTIHAAMPPAVVLLIGILFLLMGLAIAGYSTQRLIRAFTHIANPHTSGKQLINAILEQREHSSKLRIVGIGGGTGLSTLLRGLKAYPVDITAIVTVSDDGGSSGRLRLDLDMPPPGDIRNCLVALADTEPLMEGIFQHRFPSGSRDLNGHSLGNLIIAGLSEITGDFLEAIKLASRVLAVRGRVIPAANRPLVLKAVMADGTIIKGETAITARHGSIVSIGVEPPNVPPVPEALEAIRDADIIIVGPGSVYSSILPNLIIPGMSEALLSSPAIKIFVCNVMTQPGESDDFTAS